MNYKYVIALVILWTLRLGVPTAILGACGYWIPGFFWTAAIVLFALLVPFLFLLAVASAIACVWELYQWAAREAKKGRE